MTIEHLKCGQSKLRHVVRIIYIRFQRLVWNREVQNTSLIVFTLITCEIILGNKELDKISSLSYFWFHFAFFWRYYWKITSYTCGLHCILVRIMKSSRSVYCSVRFKFISLSIFIQIIVNGEVHPLVVFSSFPFINTPYCYELVKTEVQDCHCILDIGKIISMVNRNTQIENCRARKPLLPPWVKDADRLY